LNAIQCSDYFIKDGLLFHLNGKCSNNVPAQPRHCGLTRFSANQAT
jgi:hypothetical protein